MKSFFLAFLLLFSTVTATNGWGSGSNTVLVINVNAGQFRIVETSYDVKNPVYFELLEAYGQTILTIKIDPISYAKAEYATLASRPVIIAFEGYEAIAFAYEPNFDSIMGLSSNGRVLILSK